MSNSISLLKIFLLLIIISGCRQKNNNSNKRHKQIAIHTFIGDGGNNKVTYWYYIKAINEVGHKGYYLESTDPIKNFKDANFIYYNQRPLEFKNQFISNEKIKLIDQFELPKNIQHDMSELESLSVNEEIGIH